MTGDDCELCRLKGNRRPELLGTDTIALPFIALRKEPLPLNTELPATTLAMLTSCNKKAAPPKRYKSVPENWKALSETTFRQAISHLESVLFDISADGVGINTPDGKISATTLNRWAAHLRNALEALSKGL